MYTNREEEGEKIQKSQCRPGWQWSLEGGERRGEGEARREKERDRERGRTQREMKRERERDKDRESEENIVV